MRALLFWVVAMSAALIGCGGAPSEARTALHATASGLAATDIVAANVYQRRAAECLEDSATAAAYRDCVETVDRMEAGLRATHSGLLSAQAGLDAWDDGDEGETFFAAAPCLASALSRLTDTLTAAGVDIPGVLEAAVGALSGYGEGCEQ